MYVGTGDRVPSSGSPSAWRVTGVSSLLSPMTVFLPDRFAFQIQI